MPSTNFHGPVGSAGSFSRIACPVRLRSSMYSALPLAGLYISSLMTTGPTIGVPLAAPGVGDVIATKSVPPVLLTYCPKLTPARPAEVGGSARGARLRMGEHLVDDDRIRRRAVIGRARRAAERSARLPVRLQVPRRRRRQRVDDRQRIAAAVRQRVPFVGVGKR